MEKYIEKYINNNKDFTTQEFYETVLINNPNIKESTFYRILNSMCNEGYISRVSRGHYTSSIKEKYTYELSSSMEDIIFYIQKEYPLVDYQVWELYQLNEFVNHQISKNTIFVEVEPMLCESVFNLLFKKYRYVLYNPTIDEYYKYMGEDTIVVRKLISEAPIADSKGKQAILEKILVDLFEKGLLGNMIERAEYPNILEAAFDRYNINQSKLFRYARRRGLEKSIKQFINRYTNVKLEANK